MDVVAEWETLHDAHSSWDESRRLYALSFRGTTVPLVYIGIAVENDSSVRKRVRTHTTRFVEDLKRAQVDRFHVIAARLTVADGGRPSKLLHAEVENLLTREIRPMLNSMNRQHYRGRAQLRVFCRGGWPTEIAHTFVAPGWVAPQPPVRCGVCTSNNDSRFRFCGQCGTRLA